MSPTTAPHVWMAPPPAYKSRSQGAPRAALLQLKGLLVRRGNDPKAHPRGGTGAECGWMERSPSAPCAGAGDAMELLGSPMRGTCPDDAQGCREGRAACGDSTCGPVTPRTLSPSIPRL